MFHSRDHQPSIHSPAFTLKPSPDVGASGRPQIVISARVARQATRRNRVRRRLRQIWRQLERPPLIPLRIYVKKAALTMSFTQLQTELKKALGKLE